VNGYSILFRGIYRRMPERPYSMYTCQSSWVFCAL
jgi:hypothetical protein